MAKIYDILGIDAHGRTHSPMEAAKAADKIPAGASAALKPNLAIAGTPESRATTHAGVLNCPPTASDAAELLRKYAKQ